MPSKSTLRNLLTPYLPHPHPILLAQLSTYLDLLLRWNDRTNLTSVRSPEEIVRRHLGESLFAARHLPIDARTLLDFGSGAGFPGLPIQLLHPHLRVTLAESQNKKASFLREVIRALKIPTEVWAGRVQALPRSQQFDSVTLRAVDNMPDALDEAARRATHYLIMLATSAPTTQLPPNFHLLGSTLLPGANASSLVIAQRRDVPRETVVVL